MVKVKSLIDRIDESRNMLNKLIENKTDLLDPEVIRASKRLDFLLNLYNKYANQSKESMRYCL